MRAWIATGVALALAATPVLARADGPTGGGGCTLGAGAPLSCAVAGLPAKLLAAAAAPVLVAGAGVTIAHELRRRTVERQAAAAPQKTPPALALVPAARDRYRADGAAAPAPTPGAARVNETATEVGMAVTGAMVLGAVIANIVKKK